MSSIEQLNRNRESVEEYRGDSFDKKDIFWSNVSIITHAGGGLQGMTYLNCIEAFPSFYRMGNHIFEYDVEEYMDEYIISHNGGENLDGRFTSITLEEIISNLEEYQDMNVIFDCKFNDKGRFAAKLCSMTNSKSTLSRIVIQIFHETEISEIRKVYDFRMLYVCMYEADYNDVARICVDNDIYAVSISDKAVSERIGWDVFNRCNICSFIYSVNTLSRFNQLRNMGHTGVFSDFLYEKDIDENIKQYQG